MARLNGREGEGLIFPRKLQEGSQIRVIAPARSLSIIDGERRELAVAALGSLGLRVSFGKNVGRCDAFSSSGVEERIQDLHDAFADPTVDGILTVIGGYNTNQILPLIDYTLIGRNPKILCGYSDITVLSNALLRKSNLITYSGPHFSTFSMRLGFEYTKEYFRKCLFLDAPFVVEPSPRWSDDRWYTDQDRRVFLPNAGPQTLQPEAVERGGRIVGGNLGSFSLLQGTEFWPGLADSILYLEADGEMSAEYFDRHLQSVLNQEESAGITALLLGRFQESSRIDEAILRRILLNKRELAGIPVVYNLDFGHTSPMFTFPIGGTAHLVIGNSGEIALKIVRH